MANRLRKDGQQRRKPGPKPKGVTIQAVLDPVTVCLQAYAEAPDQRSAAAAFRSKIPSIHACGVADWAELVAQGLARQVFSGKEASTLLYAAQIARRK
jgi:hypothetical protein